VRTHQLSSVPLLCPKPFKLLLALFLFGLAVVELIFIQQLLAGLSRDARSTPGDGGKESSDHPHRFWN
jgi:hypothetical protein